MENKSFGGFSTGIRRPYHIAVVGGILVFSRFAAIFAGLELGGLLYLQGFAAKRPGYSSR
jgi:hypothetical protein